MDGKTYNAGLRIMHNMAKRCDEIILDSLDAQDALNEQETHVWIDGFGYPIAEEE